MKTKITLQIIFCFSLFTFNSSLIRTQTISTITGNGYNAGTSLGGYSGDGGPATAAELYSPSGIAFDASGNLYISDRDNQVIRKVNSSGTISTVAGNRSFGRGYSGDGGPATSAELYSPDGVAFDASGNLYFADEGNNVIRKVSTSGIISTIAGNYSFGAGYNGDGGPATAAELYNSTGIAFDASGNLYIADNINQVIRKVNTSGIISTVAGNHIFGRGYSGDGGAATAAELYYPLGIIFDAPGNFYIIDYNNQVIREVNTSGIISTVAGNHAFGAGYSGDGGPATSAELNDPDGMACDVFGNLYISDAYNDVIRKVNSSGIISTIAGTGLIQGYSGDGGAATAAELFFPWGVAFDTFTNLYIADNYNNVIRKVTGLITGNSEISNNDEGLIIYPNPNDGIFQLEIRNYANTPFLLDELGMRANIEIYNVLGEKVFTGILRPAQGDNTIDLTGQPNGIYLYRVITEDASLVGEGKVVIER